MNPQNVYVFLFDGYSDWEISYATPEILNSRKYGIRTFSLDGDNVISMGGLNVHPDKALSEIDTDNITMLILPGGTAWEEKKLNEIIPFTVHRSPFTFLSF